MIGQQARRLFDGATDKDLDPNHPIELVSFDLGPSHTQSAGEDLLHANCLCTIHHRRF